MKKRAFRHTRPNRIEDDSFPGGVCYEFTIIMPSSRCTVRLGDMTYKQSVQRARQLTDSARRNYYEGKVPAEKTPFLVPVVAAHVMAG